MANYYENAAKDWENLKEGFASGKIPKAGFDLPGYRMYTNDQFGFYQLQPERDMPVRSDWKFHVSVDTQDVPRAWNIVVEELARDGNRHLAKVVKPDTAQDFARPDSIQAGKMITIYDSGEYTPQQYTNLMARIEMRLQEAGIKPGPATNADRPIPGSKYASYRRETDPNGNYMASSNMENIPKEQRFNPYNSPDPYKNIDFSTLPKPGQQPSRPASGSTHSEEQRIARVVQSRAGDGVKALSIEPNGSMRIIVDDTYSRAQLAQDLSITGDPSSLERRHSSYPNAAEVIVPAERLPVFLRAKTPAAPQAAPQQSGSSVRVADQEKIAGHLQSRGVQGVKSISIEPDGSARITVDDTYSRGQLAKDLGLSGEPSSLSRTHSATPNAADVIIPADRLPGSLKSALPEISHAKPIRIPDNHGFRVEDLSMNGKEKAVIYFNNNEDARKAMSGVGTRFEPSYREFGGKAAITLRGEGALEAARALDPRLHQAPGGDGPSKNTPNGDGGKAPDSAVSKAPDIDIEGGGKKGFFAKAADMLGGAGKKSGFIGGAVLGAAAGGAAMIGGASKTEAAEIAAETAIPYGETAGDLIKGDTAAAAKSATVETVSNGASVGGAVVGAVVGQVLIPIPGVGAAVGAAVGGMASGMIAGAVTEAAIDHANAPEGSKKSFLSRLNPFSDDEEEAPAQKQVAKAEPAKKPEEKKQAENKPAEAQVAKAPESAPESKPAAHTEHAAPATTTNAAEVAYTQKTMLEYAKTAGVELDLGSYGANGDGVDGIQGEKTTLAIKTLQEKFGMAPDGKLDDAFLHRLSEENNKVQVAANDEKWDSYYDPQRLSELKGNTTTQFGLSAAAPVQPGLQNDLTQTVKMDQFKIA